MEPVAKTHAFLCIVVLCVWNCCNRILFF